MCNLLYPTAGKAVGNCSPGLLVEPLRWKEKSSVCSLELRLMWAKGQILPKGLEGEEEEGNGVQRRPWGVRKEGNLESGGPAGLCSPSLRLCEVGTHSPRLLWNPWRLLQREGEERGSLWPRWSSLKESKWFLFALGSPLAPFLSPPPQGWRFWLLLDPKGPTWSGAVLGSLQPQAASIPVSTSCPLIIMS